MTLLLARDKDEEGAIWLFSGHGPLRLGESGHWAHDSSGTARIRLHSGEFFRYMERGSVYPARLIVGNRLIDEERLRNEKRGALPNGEEEEEE